MNTTRKSGPPSPNRLASTALILGIGLTTLAAPAAAQEITVSVDPRVELASIIFRLAGSNEYNMARLEKYAADVDKYFRPYLDHPVIAYAQRLREEDSIGFNACVAITLHATDIGTLTPRFPLDAPYTRLDTRWNVQNGTKFLSLARDFAVKSKFQFFFDSHAEFYANAEQKMRAFLEGNFHLEWYGRFFGTTEPAQFRLVLGLLNGPASYAVTVVAPNGAEEINSVLGIWKTTRKGGPRFTPEMVSTIAHEFAHSYANPVIDRHPEELRPSCEPVFALVEGKMTRNHYGDWRIMMRESLVRASVIRYLDTYHTPELVRESLASDTGRGFTWIGDIADLLKDYEANRKTYPSVDDLVPRIAEVMHAAESEVRSLTKSEQQNAPSVVSMTPPNGANNVDPNIATLVVRFDRPMMDGSWGMMGDPARTPSAVGEPSFDRSKKVWTVPVKLKASHEYRFWLNSESIVAFRSSEGGALRPVEVSFKTAARSP